MIFYQKYFFYFFSIFFFISPRITLLNYSFLPTSIRVEDILLIIFFLININKILLLRFTILDKLFFLFIFYLSINYTNGYFSGQNVSIFNLLRLIEIYIIFLIGRTFEKFDNQLPKILLFVIVLNSLIVILQFFNLFPAFRAQGIYFNTSARVYGLFGGPWELAAFYPLAAMIIQNQLSNFKSLILAVFVTLISLLSGSRTFLLTLPIYLLHKFNFKHIFFIFMIGIIFFSVMIIIGSDNVLGYLGRLKSLLGIENLKAMMKYNLYTYDNIFKDWVEYNSIRNDKDPYFDFSLSKRMHKWSQVLYIYSYSIKNFILGVGIGVFGNAVDGGWIRIFAELGLIGTIIFILICYFAAINRLLIFMFLLFFITMAFIDIYQSIKITGLIFFTVGLYYEKKNNK